MKRDLRQENDLGNLLDHSTASHPHDTDPYIRHLHFREKGKMFILEGVLERGRCTRYAVDGNDIVIKNDTLIFGILQLGSYVSVKGAYEDSSIRYADKIVIR